jgi:indole-3-glycerol phosphate synthase
MVWGRMCEPDLTAAASCGVHIVNLSIPVSDIQIRHKLGRDREWVLETITRFVGRGLDLGMDVCVGGEDASRADSDFLLRVIETAERAGASLIGINNRNLRSFDTDLGHTLRLLPQLRPEQTAVAASGIKTREDIRRYQQQGVFNFLIGESLVRSENPATFLKDLMAS